MRFKKNITIISIAALIPIVVIAFLIVPYLNPTNSKSPEIELMEGVEYIASGTGIRDFGDILADGDYGTTSPDIVFTIKNTGTANLTITSISLIAGDTADFDLIDNALSSVAPQCNTSFTIRFDPLYAGSKSAVASIISNDADEGNYTFTVMGTGILSSEKTITSFSFTVSENPGLSSDVDVIGVITDTDIVARVPLGINISSLVANFTTTGINVTLEGVEQISGITPCNFTNTVTYTVTAQDSTTQDYFINVIYDEFTITPSSNALTLVLAMLTLSTGIMITDAVYYGATGQAGILTGQTGMSDGIILTSGLAINAMPPDDSGFTSYDHGTSGDPLGGLLTLPNSANDCCWLEITFDLAPGYSGILIDYIFGSEEYPESVNSYFNDGFGIFVNGETLSDNIALDPEGNVINLNCSYFVNDEVMTPPENGLEYDGSTPRLVAYAPIAGGSSGNTITIVVCDATDNTNDSGAILSRLRGIV